MMITAKKEFKDNLQDIEICIISKEKSCFLARPPLKSKQQHKMEMIEEEKKEADLRIVTLKDKIKILFSKLDEFEQKQLQLDDYTDKMGKLYELGLIDENGNQIQNDMKLG